MRNYKSYKDIKICCYAITANEPESFIDRWLDSMQYADYICVLVTKANNSNYTYFKQKQNLPKFKDKLIVEEKDIKPWRFDVARNESLKLVPSDADILICTDIDEIMIEDFWDDYRKCAFEHPDFYKIHYRFGWAMNVETGEPISWFWYDKATQRKGCKWIRPVHESVEYEDNNAYNGHYCLNENKVYLKHYPDGTKSRSSYLNLLKLRVEEDETDSYGLYYLAREYYLQRDYKQAINYCLEYYLKIQQKQIPYDKGTCSAILGFMADSYRFLGLRDVSEPFYRRGIQTNPNIRGFYIRVAQICAYSNRPQEAYQLLEEMENKSDRHEGWTNYTPSYCWRDWKKYQIIADAKTWEMKYQEAYEYITLAEKDIITEEDKWQATSEGFYGDKEFIYKKLGLIK